MTARSRWNASDIALLANVHPGAAPIIEHSDVVPVEKGFGFWDAWPVQKLDGTIFKTVDNVEIWMALGTPVFDNPDDRHSHARIHLILREGDTWTHIGPALPDGFAPGSREWSGTAIVDDAEQTVTLFFTAAGRRGEVETTFEQRLFAADATLQTDASALLTNWRNLRELVQRDPNHYMATTGGTGQVGTIKAFRDPAFFRDPADGQDYFLFAASDANSASSYNGVIAIARAVGNEWELLPPIVTADEVNNELERPHVIFHDGRYYLFWVTQRHVFNPEGPTGPTGLYGMVAESIFGEWKPLNGSGLVFGNPKEAPAQAYSWFVFPDLSVTSFIDNWGQSEQRRFGGTFAPFLHLGLEGDKAFIRS